MLDFTDHITSKVLPYGCQTLDEEEIDAVIKVLRSPYITQGPLIEQFEQVVADYCRVSYAVAFSSGTAALHAACYAAGITTGDEVITTPLTFVATSNAVLYQGAKPVFADIDESTWNLDINTVTSKLNSKTKAIMPVHFAGQPANLKEFYNLADKNNLIIIEDACHALGAFYDNQPIGQCRDMTVFSFHPVKSITTGEGGMVVTPHKHYYQKLLLFRTHGITKDPALFEYFDDSPWQYEMQILGYNYRLTDIQAAIGKVQMTKLENFIRTRNLIREKYSEAFKDYELLRLQQKEPQCRSADHLFPVCINPEATSITRLELFKSLMQYNIRPQVHYIPVHFQPYYRNLLGTKPGDFPKTERYYDNCLSLPIYPTLDAQDQQYIIDKIKTILAQ